jgi:hypothetical protein
MQTSVLITGANLGWRFANSFKALTSLSLQKTAFDLLGSVALALALSLPSHHVKLGGVCFHDSDVPRTTQE